MPIQVLAQPPARLPVPDEAALAGTTKIVAEIYKKDTDAAKTPVQKQVLAKKLLEDGRKTNDDPTSKFTLLNIARKMFSAIGDVDGAMQATESLTATFAIDAAKQKLELLTALAPQAKSADDHYALARYAGRELPAMLKAHRYDEAKALISLASAAAGKSKDSDLLKQWKRREDACSSAAKQWADVAAALTTLEAMPSNPAANGVVGKFLCLVDEDWRQGVPMLALSEDPHLQPAAKKELAGVTATADRIAIADAWYEVFAQQPKDSPQKAAAARQVAKFYRQSLSGLSVLTQRRVENRLIELDVATGPFFTDEWVEVLDLVDLSRHQIEGEWRREGLSIVMPYVEHHKSFRIPVVTDGAYELRIRAIRTKGDEPVAVCLSQSANQVLYTLNGYRNRFSGLHTIKGQGADGNASQTPAAPIRDNVPFTLHLQVEPKGDQVSIVSLFDNKRYTRWAGPKADLVSRERMTGEALSIGACHASVVYLSVQLKIKSGTARILD